jgi:mRNA interferase MazF
MIKKDFKRWHEKKSNLNDIEIVPFFHEKEIWFCYLGANVGFEQDGSEEEFLRPVVVVRKFNKQIFWGIPLTKTQKTLSKRNEKYYYTFSFLPDIQSTAILSQIKLIDARRLSRHIGYISENDFRELTKKLKALLP